MSRSQAERSACVALPELPIQLLRRRRPEWRGKPIAVVEDESPNAPLTHVSAEARARGLRRGLRQGAARNLVLDLCAGVVTEKEIARVGEELCGALRAFSPRVELEERFDGALFLDPNGLGALYGGMSAWARTVHRYLRGRDLHASVVVGFRRYRTMVVAWQSSGPLVLPSATVERDRSDQARLRDLRIDERLCDPLAMLGVTTLGDLLRLPPGELKTRFGKPAADLHELFSDDRQMPMQPRQYVPPRRVVQTIEPAESDLERLIAHTREGLGTLLADLERRGERLRSLTVTLELERYGLGRTLAEHERTRVETIEPATPTRDLDTLIELARLRISRHRLPGPAESIVLEAEGAPLGRDQLSTPDEKPQRDPVAASRAFARLRALYGQRAVCKLEVRDAHLPEARFRMTPLRELTSSARKALGRGPQAATDSEKVHQSLLKGEDPKSVRLVSKRRREGRPKRLQRRLHSPRAVGTDSRGAPLLPSRVRMLFGPHRVAGGWWGAAARATHRDYYYAEVEDGTLYWVFFDSKRGHWFVQGFVD